MKTPGNWPQIVAVVAAGILTGCSHPQSSPSFSNDIRTALDQAGLKKVSVNQDRENGVVTLGGETGTDSDKAQAESIAKSIARGLVVSDQIAVVPAGVEREARAVNTDLDKGIGDNLDAVLIESKLHDHVKYAVKNRVVTLTGEVGSESTRREAERAASSVPNVQQVVNELQVKHQKASSSQ